MNKFKTIFTLLTLVSGMLFASIAAAGQKADIKKIRAELGKMIPQVHTAEIVAGPEKGVYEMQVNGNFAYIYMLGDHVLLGDLYNTKEKVNVGEGAKAAHMSKLLEDVPTSKMISYGPEDAERYITVFTDIDCGYCRKLHLEVPQLNEAGIQVRYLAFPRAGVGSQSHKKYVSVWCNDDPQTALTTAKAGGAVADADCENPIADTYNLGKQVGVRGTPTIIFDDGSITPGYIPAGTLIKKMGLPVPEEQATKDKS